MLLILLGIAAAWFLLWYALIVACVKLLGWPDRPLWQFILMATTIPIWGAPAGIAREYYLRTRQKPEAKTIDHDKVEEALDQAIGGARVKMFITRSQRRQLTDLGYRKSEIDTLHPAIAEDLIKKEQGPIR